jgi:hypothetical protein
MNGGKQRRKGGVRSGNVGKMIQCRGIEHILGGRGDQQVKERGRGFIERWGGYNNDYK